MGSDISQLFAPTSVYQNTMSLLQITRQSQMYPFEKGDELGEGIPVLLQQSARLVSPQEAGLII